MIYYIHIDASNIHICTYYYIVRYAFALLVQSRKGRDRPLQVEREKLL